LAAIRLGRYLAEHSPDPDADAPEFVGLWHGVGPRGRAGVGAGVGFGLSDVVGDGAHRFGGPTSTSTSPEPTHSPTPTTNPTVPGLVRPGALCSPHYAYGYTDGTLMQCKPSDTVGDGFALPLAGRVVHQPGMPP